MPDANNLRSLGHVLSQMPRHAEAEALMGETRSISS